MIQPDRTLSAEHLFCLEGCRSYGQYHHMRRGFEDGCCQFCNIDRTMSTILWEDSHVLAWHVPREFMREELQNHWLIVPKRHIRFETDLTTEENASVLVAKRSMRERFAYAGGLTHVREGDMYLNAGTIPHLHYNTFVPNGTAEVRIPVFKNPDDRLANKARADGFAKRYEAGEIP